MRKFRALLLPLVMGIAAVQAATAAEFKSFSAAAFAAAQAEGRPILVDVNAPWCPVCASQGSTIKAGTASSDYAKLVIFKIDYDTQSSALRLFDVNKQGTLIAYHGKQQTGRLDFVTDKAQINALIASTLR